MHNQFNKQSLEIKIEIVDLRKIRSICSIKYFNMQYVVKLMHDDRK